MIVIIILLTTIFALEGANITLIILIIMPLCYLMLHGYKQDDYFYKYVVLS